MSNIEEDEYEEEYEEYTDELEEEYEEDAGGLRCERGAAAANGSSSSSTTSRQLGWPSLLFFRPRGCKKHHSKQWAWHNWIAGPPHFILSSGRSVGLLLLQSPILHALDTSSSNAGCISFILLSYMM